VHIFLPWFRRNQFESVHTRSTQFLPSRDCLPPTRSWSSLWFQLVHGGIFNSMFPAGTWWYIYSTYGSIWYMVVYSTLCFQLVHGGTYIQPMVPAGTWCIFNSMFPAGTWWYIYSTYGSSWYMIVYSTLCFQLVWVHGDIFNSLIQLVQVAYCALLFQQVYVCGSIFQEMCCFLDRSVIPNRTPPTHGLVDHLLNLT
jgi:hypothetical protein